MWTKLLGTKQTLLDFVKENDLQVKDLPAYEQCANCDIWFHGKDLIIDLDGNLICPICEKYYGL